MIWQHTDREALIYDRYPSIGTLLEDTSTTIKYLCRSIPNTPNLDWGKLFLIGFVS
jgi:hypothetical protein